MPDSISPSDACRAFVQRARSNPRLWQLLLGKTILHKTLGPGIARSVSDDGRMEIAFNGEQSGALKRFNSSAFDEGYLTGIADCNQLLEAAGVELNQAETSGRKPAGGRKHESKRSSDTLHSSLVKRLRIFGRRPPIGHWALLETHRVVHRSRGKGMIVRCRRVQRRDWEVHIRWDRGHEVTVHPISYLFSNAVRSASCPGGPQEWLEWERRQRVRLASPATDSPGSDSSSYGPGESAAEWHDDGAEHDYWEDLGRETPED